MPPAEESLAEAGAERCESNHQLHFSRPPMVMRTCEEKRRLGMESDSPPRPASDQLDPRRTISADNNQLTTRVSGGNLPGPGLVKRTSAISENT
jgi:hypothetical protein